MLESFMQLASTEWIPPILLSLGVIAGGMASIYLIVSGIKGIITAPRRPKCRVSAASPGRVIQWISTRPLPNMAGNGDSANVERKPQQNFAKR